MVERMQKRKNKKEYNNVFGKSNRLECRALIY